MVTGNRNYKNEEKDILDKIKLYKELIDSKKKMLESCKSSGNDWIFFIIVCVFIVNINLKHLFSLFFFEFLEIKSIIKFCLFTNFKISV